jgi:hypothetical protein
MLMNSRPREGAKEATYWEAICWQDLLKGRRLTISIIRKMPSAE